MADKIDKWIAEHMTLTTDQWLLISISPCMVRCQRKCCIKFFKEVVLSLRRRERTTQQKETGGRKSTSTHTQCGILLALWLQPFACKHRLNAPLLGIVCKKVATTWQTVAIRICLTHTHTHSDRAREIENLNLIKLFIHSLMNYNYIGNRVFYSLKFVCFQIQVCYYLCSCIVLFVLFLFSFIYIGFGVSMI